MKNMAEFHSGKQGHNLSSTSQPFTFTTPSLLITRSIYFSPKCSQHQHTFKPYYFSSPGLSTACIKLLHYCLLPGSLSWLSHVFPGSKPSCSWKPCSKHMFLHGMFIIIFSFILLVHILPVCPQRAAFSRVCTKLFDWLQASLWVYPMPSSGTEPMPGNSSFLLKSYRQDPALSLSDKGLRIAFQPT